MRLLGALIALLALLGSVSWPLSAADARVSHKGGGGPARGTPAPPGPTPIVQSGTFVIATPQVNHGVAASPQTTNPITSCAITAGDGAGDFTPDQHTCQIFFTGTGASDYDGSVPLKTATLTVQGSNANGAGTAGTLTINAYADGSVGAPSGTPQLPNLFNPPGSQSNLASATRITGGGASNSGQTSRLSGGTVCPGGQAAVVQVSGVGAAGIPTRLTVSNPGCYTVIPPNPVTANCITLCQPGGSNPFTVNAIWTATGGGYATRPPWQVAGADYAVGVPSGTSLKNPASVAATVPDCSATGHTVTCSSGTPTLDGWDFSLNNGYQIIGNGSLSSLTIKNSNFAGSNYGAAPITNTGIIDTEAPLTLLNNTIDAGNGAAGGNCAVVVFARSGVTSITANYNWIKRFSSEIFTINNTGSSTTTINNSFNLEQEGAQSTGCGAHLNYLQWSNNGGSPTGAPTYLFNTYKQTTTPAGAGEFNQYYWNVNTGGSMSSPVVSYNTFIAAGRGTVSNMLHGNRATGGNPTATMSGTGLVQNNYVDPTGLIGGGAFIYPNSMIGAEWTISGNVNLLTGGSCATGTPC